MAWRQSGDKPLSEPMMVRMDTYASPGINELKEDSLDLTENENVFILTTFSF